MAPPRNRARKLIPTTDPARPAGVPRARDADSFVATPRGARVQRAGTYSWEDLHQGDLINEGDKVKGDATLGRRGTRMRGSKGGMMEARATRRKGGA